MLSGLIFIIYFLLDVTHKCIIPTLIIFCCAFEIGSVNASFLGSWYVVGFDFNCLFFFLVLLFTNVHHSNIHYNGFKLPWWRTDRPSMVLVVWRVGDCISVCGGCVHMYRTVDVLVRDYFYFVWAISVLVWLTSFCFIIFCCVWNWIDGRVVLWGWCVVGFDFNCFFFSGYYYSRMHHSKIDVYVLYIFFRLPWWRTDRPNMVLVVGRVDDCSSLFGVPSPAARCSVSRPSFSVFSAALSRCRFRFWNTGFDFDVIDCSSVSVL